MQKIARSHFALSSAKWLRKTRRFSPATPGKSGEFRLTPKFPNFSLRSLRSLVKNCKCQKNPQKTREISRVFCGFFWHLQFFTSERSERSEKFGNFGVSRNSPLFPGVAGEKRRVFRSHFALDSAKWLRAIFCIFCGNRKKSQKM